MSLQRVSLEHELITKRTGGIQSSHMEAFTGIRRQVSINVKAQEHNREENPKPRHLYKVVYLREYGTEPP